MIEVNELSKSYGDIDALCRVSFSVRPGEIVGLLGPNGAGKTTLMKILTGYLHPTSGTARVGGLDVLENMGKVQEMIGYLPENAPLYPELSVQAYLKMVADLRRIPKNEIKERLSDAVEAVGLWNRLNRTIGTLSKGYCQRVGLAQAILHNPGLLILDEPTNGLDPTQIVEVRHLIRKLAQKSTVLVSTHILSEVEAACDRAIIIIRGEVKADAGLSELASTTDALLTLESTGKENLTLKSLSGLSGVKNAEITDRTNGRVSYRIQGDSDQDLCPAIYRLARENDWSLCELKREVRSLEAVFNELTADDGGIQ